MTMAIAVIFNVLILIYFGSKVEIVDIISDCFRNSKGIESSRVSRDGSGTAPNVRKRRRRAA